MDSYDVIIIGTRRRRRHARPAPGALGQADPPARARRLAAARAAELVGAGRVRRQPLRLAGHLVRRARASRSSRRSTTSSAARRSSTARRSTGCARRTSASFATTTASRRPGRSPTTSWSRTTRRPSRSTRCTAPAARTRPSRRRARPTRSRPSRTSRGSSSSRTTSPPPATTRSTRRAGSCSTRRTCRTARACAARLRRLPMPRPRQVRRRGARRAAGARAPERHAADEREGRQARDERRRARRSPRWSSSATARRSASPPTSWSSPAARPTRPSCSSLSASDKHPNGLANGSDQVGRNYMFHDSIGGARALARGESDDLPEDARAERLLLRRRRLRVPARQHPDGRQVAGADVPRRAAAGRRSSRRSGRWSGSPATRSTSGSRPRTCRGPTTGSPSTATASSRSATRRRTRRPKKRLYDEAQVDAREAGHEPGSPHPPLRLHEERHPGRRLRAPGRHLPLRHRPGARPSLNTDCRAHELDNLYVVDTSFFPTHRRGEPGADGDGQLAPRRRPPARAAGATSRPPSARRLTSAEGP